MKKLINQIVTVIVLAVFMLGSFSMKAQKNNPYDHYGKEHNEGLDFIYNKVISMQKTIDRKNTKSFIKNTVKDFIISKKHKIEYSSFETLSNDFIFPPNLSPTFPNFDKKKYKISDDLKKLFKKIFDLVKINNLEGLIENVNIINNKLISNQDKEMLLAVNSIGYNSLIYWKENKFKWANIIKKQSKNIRGAGKDIAGADVAGAIGGAVYAAVVNVVPGAGQVAYGGTILATGLGASASAAASALWNWAFE